MTKDHGLSENSVKPKTKKKKKHVDAKIAKEPSEDARLDAPMVRQPRVATDSNVAAPPLASSSRPTGQGVLSFPCSQCGRAYFGQAHGGFSAGALGGMAGRVSKRKSGDRDEYGKTVCTSPFHSQLLAHLRLASRGASRQASEVRLQCSSSLFSVSPSCVLIAPQDKFIRKEKNNGRS